MSLESKLRERIQEYLLDEITSVEEASTTANVPGYQTPYAFYGGRKKDKEKQKKLTQAAGYSKVNEGRYHQYRNDETLTPKQKIGKSMREVRNSLTELSRLIDMNLRLKKELN